MTFEKFKEIIKTQKHVKQTGNYLRIQKHIHKSTYKNEVTLLLTADCGQKIYIHIYKKSKH